MELVSNSKVYKEWQLAKNNQNTTKETSPTKYQEFYFITITITTMKTGSVGEGIDRELNRIIQSLGNKSFYIKIRNFCLLKKIECLKATHKLNEILQHKKADKEFNSKIYNVFI